MCSGITSHLKTLNFLTFSELPLLGRVRQREQVSFQLRERMLEIIHLTRGKAYFNSEFADFRP